MLPGLRCVPVDRKLPSGGASLVNLLVLARSIVNSLLVLAEQQFQNPQKKKKGRKPSWFEPSSEWRGKWGGRRNDGRGGGGRLFLPSLTSHLSSRASFSSDPRSAPGLRGGIWTNISTLEWRSQRGQLFREQTRWTFWRTLIPAGVLCSQLRLLFCLQAKDRHFEFIIREKYKTCLKQHDTAHGSRDRKIASFQTNRCETRFCNHKLFLRNVSIRMKEETRAFQAMMLQFYVSKERAKRSFSISTSCSRFPRLERARREHRPGRWLGKVSPRSFPTNILSERVESNRASNQGRRRQLLTT